MFLLEEFEHVTCSPPHTPTSDPKKKKKKIQKPVRKQNTPHPSAALRGALRGTLRRDLSEKLMKVGVVQERVMKTQLLHLRADSPQPSSHIYTRQLGQPNRKIDL